MGRWIAFDEESTAIAAAESGVAVSFQRGDAFDTALASAKPAIVILPGTTLEDVLVVDLIPGQRLPSLHQDDGRVSSDEAPVSYEATGFLGLTDEPVFEEEPAAPVKKWWKRLLD